jgi:hypothetical protein
MIMEIEAAGQVKEPQRLKYRSPAQHLTVRKLEGKRGQDRPKLGWINTIERMLKN